MGVPVKPESIEISGDHPKARAIGGGTSSAVALIFGCNADRLQPRLWPA
jgi:hypothetical protein